MRERKQAILLADLGFGDSGKGTIIDFLARHYQAHTVIRYNGGPQAAHNVVDPGGRHHTFSQFGSGSFVPGTRTLLSRFMLINPLNMLKEARHLESCGIGDPLQLVCIDRRALVITPFHRALNRLRELARGAERHGSCGEGIGECMADSLADGGALLSAGDLADRAGLRRKLQEMRAAKEEDFAHLIEHLPRTEIVQQESRIFTAPEYLDRCVEVYQAFAQSVELVDQAGVQAIFEREGTLLFEGAQGVLLDENYGFTPYTTWSTTTLANAEELTREHAYGGQVTRLGLTRAYSTRHGAGPFPTEDASLADKLPDLHNTWNDWQRDFRVGYLDLVALRYAREVVGALDCLAVTHIDCLDRLPERRVCTAYDYQGEEQDLPGYVRHDGTHITALLVSDHPDLARQERLTLRLQRCVPAYQNLHSFAPADHAAYLSLIAEQLGAPLALTSSGPGASEKKFLGGHACPLTRF